MLITKAGGRVVSVDVEPCDTLEQIAAYTSMTVDELCEKVNSLLEEPIDKPREGE